MIPKVVRTSGILQFGDLVIPHQNRQLKYLC